MIKPSFPALFLAGCLTFTFTSCDRKDTTQVDTAREKSLQEMQARIDDLSTRSEELNRQLAERDAADAAAKKAELEKLQTDLENQRRALVQEQKTIAEAPLPTSEPTAGSSYEVFYDRLQNDGDWIESEDYGYIWQPRVARQRNWRPYTDGHWVETDRGWTWVSNESFGWATYHYGRWVELEGSGWCWVPGNEWAPAWVSWRSSDDYIGWAPLPPEARLERGGSIQASIDIRFGTGPSHYNFIPTSDFGETTYLGRVVEPSRNVTIINQTVNVTNITYNNTRVYNHGPDYDRIRSRSRREVGRYELEVENAPREERDYTPARPEGKILKILAPVIAARISSTDQADKPARVEKKIARPQREKGWKGYDAAQVSEARANLQKQARENKGTPVQRSSNPTVTPTAPGNQRDEKSRETRREDKPALQPTPTVQPTSSPARKSPTPIITPTPSPAVLPKPKPSATPEVTPKDEKARATSREARRQERQKSVTTQPTPIPTTTPVIPKQPLPTLLPPTAQPTPGKERPTAPPVNTETLVPDPEKKNARRAAIREARQIQRQSPPPTAVTGSEATPTATARRDRPLTEAGKKIRPNTPTPTP